MDAIAYWLALVRAPLLGPRGIYRVVEHFGDLGAFFAANPTEWRAMGLKAPTVEYLAHPDWTRIEQDMAWLAEPGRQVLIKGHPGYPPLLAEIADPPPLLFVVGNVECLSGCNLAIVGSRNPSPGGVRTAHEFSEALSRAGLGIVSGLALGIDAACHQGAVAAGGITIAVGGTGPDQIYPHSHRRLAEAILASHGALVTEFPPGTRPSAGNFPRRNRIISGLTLGTLVVEAAPRSGSLITARMAVEQGREVFAVPGSIYSPLSRGCHDLIKEGAKLVQEISDILEEIDIPEPCSRTLEMEFDSPHSGKESHHQLLQTLGYDPVTVDDLVARTGDTAHNIMTMLLLLELEGAVSSTPGGGYTRLR
ncbi:MAG: DNA-processing protein DprA [Methylococcaceae bacterium]